MPRGDRSRGVRRSRGPLGVEQRSARRGRDRVRPPLGGRFAGQVGLGEQQQRLDVVLYREGDEPVDHRGCSGGSTSAATIAIVSTFAAIVLVRPPPVRRTSAKPRGRIASITTRSSAIARASTDVARHHHRRVRAPCAATPAAARFRSVGDDPGGVAADGDHARPAESVLAHANIWAAVIVTRTVTLADPLARANVVEALRGPGGPVGVIDVADDGAGVTVRFDDAVTASD